MNTAKALPRQIERYQVVRLLGSGGAGRVFECVDPVLQRRVAVKLLSASDDEAQSRFLVEARAAARLAHPGVAGLYNVGRTSDGEVFVVQEYLDGSHLGRLIEAWPAGVEPEVATHLLLQVAQALAYAHASGVIHRDVKPANVMVMADGVAKLLDFGIARVDSLFGDTGSTAITRPGTVVGTPQYMAPEQMRGEAVTHSVDIYSFGSLAYELLSGVKPHGDGSFATLVLRLLQEMPQPLQPRVPRLPPALGDLVMACLAKQPSGRPATMAEVVQSLEALPRRWDADVLLKAPARPATPALPRTGAALADAAITQTNPAAPPKNGPQ